MDVFTLVVTIIGSLISLIVDIYFIILYTHKEEPMCKPLSIICKIMILITLLQVQLQPLFLLFDVNSSRSSTTDFTVMWFAIYFSILANIAFVKPLISSLYESDEDDPCWKIILWTIIETVITMAVFGTFLGLGWLFWGKVYIPVTQITVSSETSGTISTVTETTSSLYIRIYTTVPCFLIGMLCLIGYPLLACCGAFGMTALPFSFIMDFKNRPKWIRTNQAKAITQKLKQQTVQLIKQTDSIRRLASTSQYTDGWFQRRNKNQQFQKKLTELQNKVEKHRQFYELFRLELNMKNVNPWVFILKLFVGIICLILTPLWLVQILLSQLVFPSTSVFLDKMLVSLQTLGAGFVSVAFILILTLYMIVAVLKGIFFVSSQIPLIKMHPMVQGRTWLNSFMFQTNIAVISSTALIHLMVTSFPEYLRGGDIALMMGNLIEGMLFVGVILNKKVFIYIFLIVTVLGAIYVAFQMFCLNKKSQNQLKIQKIRRKLFGQENKNKQISIQMTEINSKNKPSKQKSKNKGIKYTDSSEKSSKKNKSKVKLEFE